MLKNESRHRFVPLFWVLIALSGGLTACSDPFVPQAGEVGTPMNAQIVVNQRNPAWFEYRTIGPHYLAGLGEPEDFLHRGEIQENGARLEGDQEEIIERLKNSGANGIYVQIIRSHGGDGDSTHNPFINNDPAQGLNEVILRQWDGWLGALDAHGIAIYLFFYDDSASIWKSGDKVTTAERAFVETIVVRYSRLKHLVWVIAEEYQEALSSVRVQRLAEFIRSADPHDHPIAVHKLHGVNFDEFQDDPNIDQFLVQYNVADPSEPFTAMADLFQSAGSKFNINMAEAAEHGSGERALIRNWASAMGGAYVMHYSPQYEAISDGDLQQLGIMRRFMESTKFQSLRPTPNGGEGDVVFSMGTKGCAHIGFAMSSDGVQSAGFNNVASGRYDARWFDPMSGVEVATQLIVSDSEISVPPPSEWSESNYLVLYIIFNDTPRTC